MNVLLSSGTVCRESNVGRRYSFVFGVRRLFLWALNQGSANGRVQRADEALTCSGWKFYFLIKMHFIRIYL